MEEQIKDKKIYLVIIAIILLLLLSPIILKTGFKNEVFTSEETYLNLIKVNEAKQETSVSKQLLNHNFFHFILEKLNLSDVALAIIIPLISGIITLLLLFFILKKTKKTDLEIFLILILSALTPIFLHTFTTLNPNNLIIPLILLTTLLYQKKSYLLVIPMTLSILIEPLIGTMFLLASTAYLIIKKENKKILITTLVLSIITTLISTVLLRNTLLKLKPLSINSLLIELGSTQAYSVPLLILGIIGIFSWWEKRVDKTTTLTAFLVIFFSSIFFADIRIMAAIILAIFAGKGLNYLIIKEWALEKIKQISLILILYIILFSAIITINTQITKTNPQEVEAAKFLLSAPHQGKVLSTTNKGFMIQYISNKQTILDGNSHLQENYDQIREDVNKIFYSRVLSELEETLEKNNVTYIFIHESMKNGETWSGREEGLLFFLKHSEEFIKIFDNQAVEIYQYKK